MKLASGQHRSRLRGQNRKDNKNLSTPTPSSYTKTGAGKPRNQSRWHRREGRKVRPRARTASPPQSLWLPAVPPLPASCPPRPGLAADCTAQVSPAAVRGGPRARAARDPPRSTGHAPAAPPAAPPAERQSLRSLPGLLLYLSGK